MPKVPRIPGREAVAAFEKFGYEVDRVKGSHHILKKPGCFELLSIPVHDGKTVGTGLLSHQIKLAGLTIEEFRKLL
jgi:predicted RNA binding protein YcfA (HicA-like mRNA interferase family)